MSEQLYSKLGQELTAKFGTSTGQMFGKPCLKTTNNKAFAAFFKGEMVFKLGQKEVNLFKDKYPGSVNWDPSGKKRPMKDWLQLPADYSTDWAPLAKKALDYVEKK